MRGLADKLASRADVAFVIVYQREPHAGRMAFADLAQPATYAERRALATRAKEELGLPLLSLVDGMDDASRALFSDLPAPVFALDRFGHVAAKEPWIDVDKLPAMLDAALAARPPAGSTRSVFAEATAGAAASRPTSSRPAAAPSVGVAARALRDDPAATDGDRAQAALALATASADEKEIDAALRAAARAFGARPLRHAAALTRAAEACEAAARRDAASRFRRAALEAAAGRVDAAVEARLKALAPRSQS